MRSTELIKGLQQWGRPLAWIYEQGVRLRNTGYDTGFLRSSSVPARVVSIGNLSLGGSGKSELVVQLLQQQGGDPMGLLQNAGRIGVLSRGYRRSTRGCQVVSDGEQIFLNAAEGGDEPYMIARRCEGVPVVVSEQRLPGAHLLCDQYAVDTILLDDGFQHRALVRDLDLVILDCSLVLRGQDRLLPAGRLREPYDSLRRAQVILFNHCASATELTELRRRITPYFKGSCWNIREIDYQLREAWTGKPATAIPTVAFAGLADTSHYFAAVQSHFGSEINCLTLPDHAPYDARQLQQVRNLLIHSNDIPVTTWKDAVKLTPEFQKELQLLVLEQKWLLGELDEA
ncbi:MAG: tetraacyldisaccharide 4'-kinase [Candidatus Delongbacteria bacterium]|nr:tetraacyldisaccharide 4'-kinase [Candidatus Delongbacteria bacterium]